MVSHKNATHSGYMGRHPEWDQSETDKLSWELSSVVETVECRERRGQTRRRRGGEHWREWMCCDCIIVHTPMYTRIIDHTHTLHGFPGFPVTLMLVYHVKRGAESPMVGVTRVSLHDIISLTWPTWPPRVEHDIKKFRYKFYAKFLILWNHKHLRCHHIVELYLIE